MEQKHCTNEVCVEYEEFKTDVTRLFLPVHAGTVSLIRKLLKIGNEITSDAHLLPATNINYIDGLAIFAYMNSTRILLTVLHLMNM
ncbi:Subtilisin-like protease SBT5.4 [Camellia lanceoleosa]|uniref:Subtilisin-like protease SBT5.4 n=1 Tax=Camellia lanceoleosa TaxID=1840588 RepID=A0ACC0IJS3_9ERIC|nr:Subtilisin-like protease SBT5.4 [Camellia lanceoleosa]